MHGYTLTTGTDVNITADVVLRRVMGALERSVLHKENPELRDYFAQVISATTSVLGGVRPEEDGISGASDDELEQSALLLCHHDTDGDGLLAPSEFAAVIELVTSQSGSNYTPEHVEGTFAQCDIDRSGFIDLNELLLLRRRSSH